MEFVNENGLECSDDGWREWCVHYEGEDKNNVYLVQHIVEEK